MDSFVPALCACVLAPPVAEDEEEFYDEDEADEEAVAHLLKRNAVFAEPVPEPSSRVVRMPGLAGGLAPSLGLVRVHNPEYVTCAAVPISKMKGMPLASSGAAEIRL